MIIRVLPCIYDRHAYLSFSLSLSLYLSISLSRALSLSLTHSLSHTHTGRSRGALQHTRQKCRRASSQKSANIRSLWPLW